mmetsp:Transcript_19663/g.34245  ORF Transcript_19663/g.34245 Transcript_19663/m.34245 type:complete len:200 (+) Transcript_19663:1155-1754(+)
MKTLALLGHRTFKLGPYRLRGVPEPREIVICCRVGQCLPKRRPLGDLAALSAFIQKVYSESGLGVTVLHIVIIFVIIIFAVFFSTIVIFIAATLLSFGSPFFTFSICTLARVSIQGLKVNSECRSLGNTKQFFALFNVLGSNHSKTVHNTFLAHGDLVLTPSRTPRTEELLQRCHRSVHPVKSLDKILDKQTHEPVPQN